MFSVLRNLPAKLLIEIAKSKMTALDYSPNSLPTEVKLIDHASMLDSGYRIGECRHISTWDHNSVCAAIRRKNVIVEHMCLLEGSELSGLLDTKRNQLQATRWQQKSHNNKNLTKENDHFKQLGLIAANGLIMMQEMILQLHSVLHVAKLPKVGRLGQAFMKCRRKFSIWST